MAPVVAALRSFPARFHPAVCSTGQHRQMLQQILSVFQISPDIELDLMTSDQGLAGLTAALIRALDPVIERVQPAWILAQGDTTSVMVAALAAFYRRVKFGHIEAGLRAGDRHRPFPEEVNRRIVDLVADLYFAPTGRARETLIKEGVPDASVVLTGNTVVDALMDVVSRPFDLFQSPLAQLPQDAPWVLVTAHRRESFGAPFRQLCHAIGDLAKAFPDHHFIYPVHLNPNVRKPVGEILGRLPNLSLIEPLDYVAMVQLMKRAVLILTDSGGIQEEAPALRVPVLVMRDATERPEGVEAGFARLVGTQRERIFSEAAALLHNPDQRQRMVAAVNPYGDGQAAARIVQALASYP